MSSESLRPTTISSTTINPAAISVGQAGPITHIATKGFVRRSRIAPPAMPGGEVNLQAPPDIPRIIPGGILGKILPLVMVVAVVGMIALMVVTGGRSIFSNPMYLMFPVMMLMSMAGMYSGARGGSKKAGELNEERKDYFRYLQQTREEIYKTVKLQRDSLEWSNPTAVQLLSIIGQRRMWERRSSDADYCHVRVGIGAQRLATNLLTPDTGPVEDIEPVSAVALRRFIRTHSVVHALPTAVSLRSFPAINIESVDSDGAKLERIHSRAQGLVRSMVLQMCTFHGPEAMIIAVVVDDCEDPLWSWLKWLPHNAHPTKSDRIGPRRMIFESLGDCELSLEAELLERGRFSRNSVATPGRFHLVIIISGGLVTGEERALAESGMDSVTVLDLRAPKNSIAVRRGLQLVVSEGGVLGARSVVGVENFGVSDQLSVVTATAYARRLARYRSTSSAQLLNLEIDGPEGDPGLMSLLGIADAAHLDSDRLWQKRFGRERLRVPIGYSPTGAPVEIDIKESAEGGMGPHGLCIGATGSGKSEFLRTLVLSLITTHSPDQLNLVLVDFKGGATFLGLEAVPHVSAVITNLEEELVLVDRMRDALSGEMNRRQELLRAAGNFANVGDYEKARLAGAGLLPLPALFIVVDEFSELLSQKPDFTELFVAIGRLGRSLHMHLLLASQRLEEGKLRGLDSHLSYRIGLKTFSANESRSVLGVSDAYHLPSIPGAGFLKCDSADPIRFNACYVSGPYESLKANNEISHYRQGYTGLRFFTAAPVVTEIISAQGFLNDSTELTSVEPSSSQKVLDSALSLVVAQLIGKGNPAHEVWLPPLEIPPSLDRIILADTFSEVDCASTRLGNLRFPIGFIDKPYDQRRDILELDLTGAAGNVAIVGGPQAGKSTALRTMILSAALTHTPEQLSFYCIDFGGGSLGTLDGVPHVGGVATRADDDGLRRTIAEILGVVRRREKLFTAYGLASMQEFRQRDDLRDLDGQGDIFLVLDGLGTVRADYEFLEEGLNSIVLQGLSYGVHVIVTALRWAEIRPGLKDLIGTRIELRLGDPIDSEMDRRAAATVPVGRPGRGITAAGLHFLLGVPYFLQRQVNSIDSRETPEILDFSAATAATVELLQKFYPNQVAKAVRLLSSRVSPEEISEKLVEFSLELSSTEVALGIGELDLAPVIFNFSTNPHLMAFADMEQGKTTLLRTIIGGLLATNTAESAKFVVVDYRRTLLGVVPTEYLAGYASSYVNVTSMMDQLATQLASRLPSENVTAQQLRDRSWWTGPEVYLVVDDYDLVASAGKNPLAVLAELLPQARDIGFHLVVARRSGGASRALYDAVLGKMKELSVETILMRGDREEGYIVGQQRFQNFIPGRGMLISRTKPSEVVQFVFTPEVSFGEDNSDELS